MNITGHKISEQSLSTDSVMPGIGAHTQPFHLFLQLRIPPTLLCMTLSLSLPLHLFYMTSLYLYLFLFHPFLPAPPPALLPSTLLLFFSPLCYRPQRRQCTRVRHCEGQHKTSRALSSTENLDLSPATTSLTLSLTGSFVIATLPRLAGQLR